MIPFQKRVLLKIVSFKLYSYLIGIVTSRISVELDNSKSLNINTYEIRIDSSFNQENSSKDKSLIKTYLFECQCALFLVDITKEDSFILIKAFLATIGIDKELNNVKIGDEVIKITLWDTTGQERFKSLPKKYYQNADGVLLLFDVTEEETFNNVTKWMNDVKDNSNKNFSNEDGKESDIALYLIGNKIDLPGRVITREQAEIQAKSLGMKYFEVSCKINMNIPEVMARMIIDCNMKANHNENSFKLKSKKGDKKKKWGCCGEKEKKINN